MDQVKENALIYLLKRFDPGGFLTHELGLAWVDDGSGYARKLVASGEHVLSSDCWCNPKVLPVEAGER